MLQCLKSSSSGESDQSDKLWKNFADNYCRRHCRLLRSSHLGVKVVEFNSKAVTLVSRCNCVSSSVSLKKKQKTRAISPALITVSILPTSSHKPTSGNRVAANWGQPNPSFVFWALRVLWNYFKKKHKFQIGLLDVPESQGYTKTIPNLIEDSAGTDFMKWQLLQTVQLKLWTWKHPCSPPAFLSCRAFSADSNNVTETLTQTNGIKPKRFCTTWHLW